jgi:pentose-5-phosphate-3-epimerase
MDKEGKKMSPHALAKIAEKKKSMTDDIKNKMLKAGGSIKTRNSIDAQEICREVRGKQ